MKIKITMYHAGRPPGKLADAELHFEDQDGLLGGLRLVGFAVWQRRGGTDRRVTFPARRYSLGGEQRSYALLRPVGDGAARAAAEEQVRKLILRAFEQHEAAA